MDPYDESQRDLTEVRGVEEATTRSGQENVKMWSNARASHMKALLTRGSKAREGPTGGCWGGTWVQGWVWPHMAEEGPTAGYLETGRYQAYQLQKPGSATLGEIWPLCPSVEFGCLSTLGQ